MAKVGGRDFGTLGDILYRHLGLGVSIQLPHYKVRTASAALRHLLSCEVAQTAEHHATLIAAESGVEAVVDWAVDTLHSSRDGAEI